MYMDFKSQQTTQQMYFLLHFLDEDFSMLLEKCVLQDVSWGTPAYGTFVQRSVAMWIMGTKFLFLGSHLCHITSDRPRTHVIKDHRLALAMSFFPQFFPRAVTMREKHQVPLSSFWERIRKRQSKDLKEKTRKEVWEKTRQMLRRISPNNPGTSVSTRAGRARPESHG